jgi:hypothetical protein
MQGFWAILPLNLASEYTSRVRSSRDCKLFFFLQQALTYRELSPPECRLTKWELPISLKTSEIEKQTSLLPLLSLQKPLFPCCQDDRSCLDEQISGENGKLIDLLHESSKPHPNPPLTRGRK